MTGWLLGLLLTPDLEFYHENTGGTLPSYTLESQTPRISNFYPDLSLV